MEFPIKILCGFFVSSYIYYHITQSDWQIHLSSIATK